MGNGESLPHKFHFYRCTEFGQWAEFECGNCHCDMDFDVDDVPKAGSEFMCPYCDATRTVEYREEVEL